MANGITPPDISCVDDFLKFADMLFGTPSGCLKVYDEVPCPTMTKKKSRKVLIPTFEIAVCPTINLREMMEYRAKCQGLLVVYDEQCV